MSSLPGIVYECAARVNNTRGNERVMFPGIAFYYEFIVYKPGKWLHGQTTEPHPLETTNLRSNKQFQTEPQKDERISQ